MPGIDGGWFGSLHLGLAAGFCVGFAACRLLSPPSAEQAQRRRRPSPPSADAFSSGLCLSSSARHEKLQDGLHLIPLRANTEKLQDGLDLLPFYPDAHWCRQALPRSDPRFIAVLEVYGREALVLLRGKGAAGGYSTVVSLCDRAGLSLSLSLSMFALNSLLPL